VLPTVVRRAGSKLNSLSCLRPGAWSACTSEFVHRLIFFVAFKPHQIQVIDHLDRVPHGVRRAAQGAVFDLAQLAGGGRIAIGDVRSVPAGIYAKEALEKLGSWDAAAPKIMMTQDVRSALALVAHEEASLGIVYATDAKIEPS
jgi:hypothetical protein